MAEKKLQGRTIAILATDGVEQAELTEPREALEEAGATTELVSLDAEPIQAFKQLDYGDKFEVDRRIRAVSAGDYDGLLIPGGIVNSDFLRGDADACLFVADFATHDKPIAAICHGPWLLVETGIVSGRTLTSVPSLRTDVENAGGTWVDDAVHVDHRLITSQNRRDLSAFTAKMVEEFAKGPRADLSQPQGRFTREATAPRW